jgi:copper ion binding protein
MQKTISIEGMMCGHCTGRVETALNALEGVKVLETSVDKKHAIIEVENVSDDLIKETIEDVGYDVLGIE